MNKKHSSVGTNPHLIRLDASDGSSVNGTRAVITATRDMQRITFTLQSIEDAVDKCIELAKDGCADVVCELVDRTDMGVIRLRVSRKKRYRFLGESLECNGCGQWYLEGRGHACAKLG